MKRLYFYMVLLLLPLLVACNENAVTTVKLSQSSMALQVNEQRQLEVVVEPIAVADDNYVFWKTSDESVATVDDEGNVTAVYSGTCVITATCGGVLAKCEVTVEALSYNLNFTKAVGYVYGDYYDIGGDDIILRLLSDGLDIQPDGTLSGEGYFMNIDLNSSFVDNYLAVGIYQTASTPSINSCISGSLFSQNGATYVSGTYLGDLTSNGLIPTLVNSGTLVVHHNGYYELTADFTGSMEENISAHYLGNIQFIDKTTTSGTFNFDNFTFQLTCLNARDTAAFNTFQLQIQSEDGQYQLVLEMYAPLTSTSELPVGVYTLSSSQQEASFSMKRPSYDESTQTRKGCWLISGGNYTGLLSGTLQVSRTSNVTSYSFSFKDMDGHIIQP